MAVVSTSNSSPKSLKGRMSCNMNNCPSGLHCFRKLKRKRLPLLDAPPGACQACGRQGLIDWDRVRRCDFDDVDFTIQELKKECVRYHYWCLVELSEGAINHARRKGRIEMREHAEKVIRRDVGAAQNFRDGSTTPWEGDDAVHYARHATAICCRKCIEYWHGIESGRDLTEGEIQYLTNLIMRFIETKISLTETKEFVPRRKRKGQALQPQAN